MAAPGTAITVTASSAAPAVDTPTGHAFAVGLSARGPVGRPVLLHSMTDFAAMLGARQNYSVLYDWADTYFHEGGSSLYVSRIVGPAATTASLTLKDRAGTPLNTLTVSAIGPGVDGNSLTVAVVNGVAANTFQLQVYYAGTLVETSAVCSQPSDAVNWAAANSNYIAVANAGSATAAPNNNPAVLAATALIGGADDNSNAGDTQYTTGLTAFTSNYGPGQVACPGQSTAATIEALLAHCQANNRVGLADAPNTGTAATITTLTGQVQAAASDPSYGTMVAPWNLVPGIPTGTAQPSYPRTVPGSALAAGLIARSDASNDANIAAAGRNGVARYCLDVTQTFVDADRSTLDAAGVSVIRNFGVPNSPQVELFGWSSLAVDPNWEDLSSVRLRMGIVNDLKAAAGAFDFSQIDAQGKTIGAFNGALGAALLPYWVAGSLYGQTPADAFSVNTGPQVNTPTTIAARTLVAQVSLRMSPSAEVVTITITKVPTTVPLAA